jgi:leucine dehydrogenase
MTTLISSVRPQPPGILDGSYEGLHVCNDSGTGLLAVVCIDSTRLGPADGGVRMHPYPTFAAAVEDVSRLARSMTLKWAAAGEARGGGKAVIVGDPRREKTEALLRRFGRFVDSLGGSYWAGADSGLDLADMEVVHAETEYVATLPTHAGGAGDIAPATAAGVLHAMRACGRRAWGTGDLRGRRVALQGVGECGRHALAQLVADGAEVVVCDVDERRVRAAVEAHGVRAVDPDAIYDVPADVFAPFALGGAVDRHRLARLDVSVICGSANNVMVDDATEAAAVRQGMVYGVDFVVNAGGAIMDADRFAPGGYEQERVAAKLAAIGPRLTGVLDAAERDGLLPSHAARRLAEARLRGEGAGLRSPA